MLDLAIVLGLVVLNALAHAAYVRWRNAPKTGRARQSVRRVAVGPITRGAFWEIEGGER